MQKQYLQIKDKYKDCILFFRLGDFYEMFYDDAVTASKILDLVLTSRGTTEKNKYPMCGIPFHAADNYIPKLIKAGKKVAICEQVENPQDAVGIVKRDVIRIISSGTYIEENAPNTKYILSLSPFKKSIGVAFISTVGGKLYVNRYSSKTDISQLMSCLHITECIFPESFNDEVKNIIKASSISSDDILMSPRQDWHFDYEMSKKSLLNQFDVLNLSGFGIEDNPEAVCASGGLLEYLKLMNKQPLKHISALSVYNHSEYTFISSSAIKGLDISGLFNVIDYTVTAMGKRTLSFWVHHPLKDTSSIEKRQNAVKLLHVNKNISESILKILKSFPDIEKNISRLSCGYTQAKDFLALRNALLKVPLLLQNLAHLKTQNDLLSLNDITQLRLLLARSINPDMPLSNYEGKVIQKGYNIELDNIRDIQENASKRLKDLQAREIKKTGINSLKIGFNKIFGYYIEITKSNLSSIGPDYIRKQTLVNAERFITPELKEFEETMLTAQEKVLSLEEKLIKEIKNTILSYSSQLSELASSIANIDSLNALAYLSHKKDYILPKINNLTSINIIDGRHPLVEDTVADFIPNDTVLDCDDNHLLLITGPNMAGKSTYIRQTALLVILAQIGSYIPAKTAEIGIVDKIFTRIGAQDNIDKGQSTFMVEMSETAEIINNLSSNSLVILDEIGRGTSTFDGLSLAWSIADYLGKKHVRTLFATHFHELTALKNDFKGMKNYNVSVKEWQDKIIFLHKIISGAADDSYGIYVAKLAGIPKEIINHAKHILLNLETSGNLEDHIRMKKHKEIQPTLFDKHVPSATTPIIDELSELDINTLTPLDALNKITQWQKRINNNG
ncbi:MAG: DNA mismatch repair protein MutS [Candidatus Omnitrophica bacterium]|nr:DNA mismatch repair protein MutS [Candidatus Omnitrophota bacterium]MDD5081453.1 DNA mismatch repair protein MutS [Candidatus Omnitrophota bacterium]